jgi:hypothetical protein
MPSPKITTVNLSQDLATIVVPARPGARIAPERLTAGIT